MLEHLSALRQFMPRLPAEVRRDYAPGMRSRIQAMGVMRALVGVSMLAAPRLIGRNDNPAFVLLMRTIGVRDLVLGVGAATAAPLAQEHWGRAALASDAIDVAVGTLAIPKVGAAGGLVAALLPVPFVAADVWELRD